MKLFKNVYVQPLSSISPSPPSPSSKPFQVSLGRYSGSEETSSATLKFGRITYLTERIFKPITEDYFWGFLARDILGLWAPRIVNSLHRGRVPYNPQSDPLYGKREKLEQWIHEKREGIRGLNYWNAWEETAREIQSGPGWMIAHSILFGVSMLQMKGKRALMMSHNELKHFFGLLGLALPQKDLEQFHRLPPSIQRERMLKAFLKKALNPNFEVAYHYALSADKIAQLKNRFASPAEKSFANWVQSEFGRQLRTESVRYGDILNAWIEDYTKLFRKPASQKAYLPKLLKLEMIFEELVDQINTRAKPHLAPADVSALRIQSALNPKETVRMTAQSFLSAMNKFATGLGEISKRIHPTQILDRASFQGVLEASRRDIVQRKFVLSPLATILGCVLAFYVAAISQNKKRVYPANRLIPLPNHSAGRSIE